MRPDATKHHDPDPRYLRDLVARAGMPRYRVAQRIGISERMLRYYLADGLDGKSAPYTVQYALEKLAKKRG